MNVNTYQQGESIGIWAYIRDWDKVYTNPDNGVKLTLTDPLGVVKVNNLAMTAISTGKFMYHYNIPSDAAIGWWTYSCKSQDGTGTDAFYTIDNGGFQVE